MTVASTLRLTSERLELVSDTRARAFMRAALIIMLVVVGAAAGLRLLADSNASLDRHSRLQQDHAALQAELARLEAELALEQAIRAALDQQVAELNGRIADLDSQLAFVHAQGRRTPSAAPPH